MKILLIKYLILFFLFIQNTSCNNDANHHPHQPTILDLQIERDSLIVLNDSLYKELEKCDEWVQMLEREEK